MEKNIGVYICSGCEIGNCIEIESLEKVANTEYHAKVCQTHPGLCQKDALNNVHLDIQENKLDGVVIAACSPRIFTKKLSLSPITERVNLRELVAWSHEAGNEDTTMLAEDSLRMGVARINSILDPKPFIPENPSSDILVIGGGITGITAAIEGAKAGYRISLVEKNSDLGGWSNFLYKQLPLQSPFDYLEEPIIKRKVDSVREFENIDILTSSTIKEISGQPGAFNVVIDRNGEAYHKKVASVVMATGWKPYDANNLTHLGFGINENIITNLDFEKMIDSGKLIRPSDGKTPERILFIQCAGSRDENHLSYCSNFCCSTSLKQAQYVREFSMDTSVFVVYKDIRTPGKFEEFYKKAQSDDQIFLTKGDISDINTSGEKLLVEVKDSLFGGNIQLDVDLIVLAVGMTPNSTEDLNLNYRLGKGLPELKYEFPDSHFICFPYETRRTGIYAAGSLRAPMDIASSIFHA